MSGVASRMITPSATHEQRDAAAFSICWRRTCTRRGAQSRRPGIAGGIAPCVYLAERARMLGGPDSATVESDRRTVWSEALVTCGPDVANELSRFGRRTPVDVRHHITNSPRASQPELAGGVNAGVPARGVLARMFMRTDLPQPVAGQRDLRRTAGGDRARLGCGSFTPNPHFCRPGPPENALRGSLRRGAARRRSVPRQYQRCAHPARPVG